MWSKKKPQCSERDVLHSCFIIILYSVEQGHHPLLLLAGSTLLLHALASSGLACKLLNLSIALGLVTLFACLLHDGQACRLVLLARRLPGMGAAHVADGRLDKCQIWSSCFTSFRMMAEAYLGSTLDVLSVAADEAGLLVVGVIGHDV